MSEKPLTPEERVGCSVAVAVWVVAAAAHAWNLRGFLHVIAIVPVVLAFGAATGLALGNVVLGAMRLAAGRPGVRYVVGGLLVAVLSGAAPLFPAAPDHVLVDLPFGMPMLEARQEALDRAIYEEDVETTRRLAAAGVGSRDPRDGFGAPLFGATRNPEVLRAALEGGLDPDAPDTQGYTRLMSPWSKEIAEVLLEFGASPDVHGPEGRTALMFAVMSDDPWAPSLIEASTDLRAVDETGHSVIDYTPPGSDLERLLQAKAGVPPLRRLEDGAAAPGDGRTDWLVSAEAAPAEAVGEASEPFAGSSLSLESPRLLRGDLVDLEIRLRNATAEPMRLRVEGRISAAAYFVGGSHDVTISNPYRGQFLQEFRWPRLWLPAGAEGELGLELLTRAEEAGALDVTIMAADPYRDLRTNLSLLQGPVGDHPEVTVPVMGDAGWTYLVLVATAALALGYLVWHRGGAKKRVFLLCLVGAFAVCGLFSLLTAEALLEGVRAHTDYRETTCTVLDRRLLPQTSTVANPGATRSRTTTTYLPRLALRYETAEGERISEGFAVGLVNAGDLRNFALGQQYPCWYDPENEREVVVKRSLNPLWIGLLVLPVVLGLGALVVISWEVRDGRRDAHDR